jgi:hypothetical protein
VAARTGAAYAQDFTILHHERLTLTSSDTGAGAGNAKPEDRGARLHFVAFGRRFDVELVPNDALFSGLPAEEIAALADLELYRGELAGVPGSWVRLSRYRDALSGMIWDGVELYGIDDYREVAPLLTAADAGAAGPIIYRWSETVGELSDAVEDLIGAKPSESAGALLGPIALSTGIRPGKQLDVGLIADVEYAAREGAATQATLLSMLNIVDGIFIKQVGIRVSAASIKIFDAETDPFTSLDAGQLLDELESYKDATPETRALGAAHLFTGRDLNDPPGTSGQRIGVANLGQLCSARFSTGLSQATFGTATNAVIFAHELGHVFGAPHDGAGACAAAPAGYIMAPLIQGSQELSSCSVEQMLPKIATATCLRNLPGADISLQTTMAPPTVVGQDELVRVGMWIVNRSAQPAVGVELTASGQNFASFSLGGIHVNSGSCFFNPFRCVWPYVEPNQTLAAELRFVGQQPGVGSIDISVFSLNETDSANDQLHFDIEVLPKVDLAVTVEPPGLWLHPGESGTVHVTIANRGAMQATNVNALLQVRQSTEIVDFGIGPCIWNGKTYLYGYDCVVGDLGPGGVKRFDVIVRARTGLTQAEMDFGGWLDVTASAREPDASSQNNRASSRLTLGSSIAELGLTLLSPSELTVDQRFEIELKVRNNGPDAAEGIEIQQYQSGLPLSRSFTEISTTLGACTMQAPANDFFCSVPQLPTGQELTIKFAGTATAVGDYSLGVQSWMRSSDRESSNNAASLFVRAVAQPPPPSPAPATASAATSSSSGGGGATDFATLLALALGWLSWCVRDRPSRTAPPRSNSAERSRDL